MSSVPPSSGPDTSRRRSQRVMVSLPITISGKIGQAAFTEETRTTVINAHGALIALKAKVWKDQTVSLKSRTSSDELECRVIWVGPTADGKTQCGIEFIKPAPKFWGVSFPPVDWSAAAMLAEPRKK
jgi:hypothetical protein